MINHYRTLGVDPQAEAAVIRRAYLALIRRYHPDRGGEEADAARAQAVTAAWDVLRDPERRAAYDEARRARFHPEGPAAAEPVGGAARVRGGAAARNLFLLLAVGTVGLGWWAFQQPRSAPPAERVVKTAAPVPSEPPIRPARIYEQAEPEPLPSTLVERREPEVEVAVTLSPLPSAEPARSAEAQAVRRPEAPREAGTVGAPPVQAPTGRTRLADEAIAAPARLDLAPLERHLQLLTDQSFRYGTEAKRVRLAITGETFLKRLRDCDTDSCRRDTYLRRNAEVGAIMQNAREP